MPSNSKKHDQPQTHTDPHRRLFGRPARTNGVTLRVGGENEKSRSYEPHTTYLPAGLTVFARASRSGKSLWSFAVVRVRLCGSVANSLLPLPSLSTQNFRSEIVLCLRKSKKYALVG